MSDTLFGAEKIFTYVEEPPIPLYDFSTYLRENVSYPKNAMRNGTSGRVVVRFVIGEDGSISDVTVVKGVSPELDEEAKRVISKMPNWEPANQKGKPVKIFFTQPINFSLE
jgi:protein TonB